MNWERWTYRLVNILRHFGNSLLNVVHNFSPTVSTQWDNSFRYLLLEHFWYFSNPSGSPTHLHSFKGTAIFSYQKQVGCSFTGFLFVISKLQRLSCIFLKLHLSGLRVKLRKSLLCNNKKEKVGVPMRAEHERKWENKNFLRQVLIQLWNQEDNYCYMSLCAKRWKGRSLFVTESWFISRSQLDYHSTNYMKAVGVHTSQFPPYENSMVTVSFQNDKEN